ncbi:chymotrypsin-2-like [Venturia canescens]|uniref:chymotrypsin-2-like n=1 Tax=Venturia canescens TaxID=32260 RepID=UPI001C9D373F|nr:chymotrypsin-2-like [Venturia canescens]
MSFCNSRVYFILLLASSAFFADATRPQKLLSSTDAAPGELKYTVSLQYRNYHQCGGALISERHVLTAAHCFVGREEAPYTKGLVVVTGATNLISGGEHHYAKYVTVHPEYVQGNSLNRWRHDIAVITLVTPAVKNAAQAPVSLPSSDVSTNVTGIVSGWGQLGRKWDAGYPNVLQKRSVSILTRTDCNSRNPVLDTQICGLDGKDTGFCHGDSGGPLVYNDEIVGVVSFGVSCGIGYPDVYTRVWSYRDFISEAMSRQ